MQLCAAPLLHSHEEVDAHMARKHDSSGVEYFSFHIQPSLCSVIAPPTPSKGFIHDEFEAAA